MTTRLPQTLNRLRPASRRRGDRLDDRSETPLPAPCADEARAREAGGPDDNAIYTCCCGVVFSAPVSASVSCPVCAGALDW